MEEAEEGTLIRKDELQKNCKFGFEKDSQGQNED